MSDIKRIIIPVDNSENSEKAIKQGVYLAKALKIEVKIINVNDTHHFISSVILEDRLKKESQVFLDNFKKIAEPFGVNIETELITGKPAEEIIKYAKKDDLIIITYNERTKGLDKIINKSVSNEVIQKAQCSVYVVK